MAQSGCNCNQITEPQIDELISNNDSSAIYQTINKLKQSTDKICRIIAYNIEVDYLIPKKKLTEALVVIQEQEKHINELPCKKELAILSYLNYANHSKFSQNYEALSAYAFKALEAAEALNDKQKELKAIAYIVHLNTRQNQDEKNWTYVKRGEKIILALKDEYNIASNYNWLAFEYEQKFSQTERRGLMDTAMIYSAKALGEAGKKSNYVEITRCYRLFESNAASKENYRAAVGYADSAIFYLKKIRVPANPAALYLTKALDYKDLKEFGFLPITSLPE